jgi:hypothetical protein
MNKLIMNDDENNNNKKSPHSILFSAYITCSRTRWTWVSTFSGALATTACGHSTFHVHNIMCCVMQCFGIYSKVHRRVCRTHEQLGLLSWQGQQRMNDQCQSAVDSWLHEYYDVHVRDSSIQLLLEVYVIDGAIRCCEGGRLPHETMYHRQ